MSPDGERGVADWYKTDRSFVLIVVYPLALFKISFPAQCPSPLLLLPPATCYLYCLACSTCFSFAQKLSNLLLVFPLAAGHGVCWRREPQHGSQEC